MSNATDEPTEHTVMPSPYLQVIFPLAGRIAIEGIPITVEQPFVAPILSCFKKISIAPGAEIFGMHLLPYYGSALFSGSPAGLERNAHLLQTIFNQRQFAALVDAILLAKNFEERADRAMMFFEKLSGKREHGKRDLLQALFVKMNTSPNLSLCETSSEMGFSTRWIQKLHKELTGVSPHEMFRIVRFNTMLNKLYNLQGNTTQMAIDCGYYDQAHAIREFKKLGGTTPAGFARLQPPINKVLNYHQ